MKYLELMAEVNTLRDQVKARSMIFDVSTKELCADAFGLKFNAFYDLPYKLWGCQSERLTELLRAMSRDIDDVEAWCGQDLHKTPYTDWYHIYRDWLKEV